MAGKVTIHNRMRIWHRYLGFFLLVSWLCMHLARYRSHLQDTDFLKQEKQIEKSQLLALKAEAVGQSLFASVT